MGDRLPVVRVMRQDGWAVWIRKAGEEEAEAKEGDDGGTTGREFSSGSKILMVALASPTALR